MKSYEGYRNCCRRACNWLLRKLFERIRRLASDSNVKFERKPIDNGLKLGNNPTMTAWRAQLKGDRGPWAPVRVVFPAMERVCIVALVRTSEPLGRGHPQTNIVSIMTEFSLPGSFVDSDSEELETSSIEMPKTGKDDKTILEMGPKAVRKASSGGTNTTILTELIDQDVSITAERDVNGYELVFKYVVVDSYSKSTTTETDKITGEKTVTEEETDHSAVTTSYTKKAGESPEMKVITHRW